jgi:SpoVK/Ycf46/Vps4 family AAA+-type ATPase
VERKGVLSHKDSQTGYLQSVLSRPLEGVHLIGTDNNPNFLKGPFVDRFVHKLYFGMPSSEEQKAIWMFEAPEADADRLAEEKNNLSCRDISYACKQARDYGLELTTEVLSKLVEDISNTAEDYSGIISEIGDSVANYRKVEALQKEEK